MAVAVRLGLAAVIAERPPRVTGANPLEALVREARRRTRRRRLGYGLASALAAGAAVGGWFLAGGSGSTRSGGPSPGQVAAAESRIVAAAKAAPVGEAGLTGGVGWAMNGYGLWLTANGGSSWLTATPPHVRTVGDAVARIGQIEFVDRTHGWLSAADVVGGFPLRANAPSWRHMEIDRTTDGGRTWQASVPPGCLQTCGGVSLSFLDARRGFAIAAQGFFATRDAGATWTRVSRPPFSGAITFLDARHGFGVSDPARWGGPRYAVPFGGGVPFRTTDGGRTWERIPLAPPAAYSTWQETAGPAAFFGERGVLPVRFRDAKGHVQRLVVYATDDGGATWAASPAPADVLRQRLQWGIPWAPWFSAASPRVWVVAGARTLHVTTDGGRSWRTVAPLDLPSGARIWFSQFTSAADGWADLFLDDGPVLVRTRDGGRMWAPLAPPVPKPKPARKAKPACSSPCRRP